MPLPLDGIRVIECANYVAGPSIGALMADLGADVIKVEPPGGEVMRGVQVSANGGPSPINYLFELENRGKRSVVVALDKPGGPGLVLDLIAGADVFLTNLIAPRLAKYRLSPEDVLARSPLAVHVSVTGYGLTGPDAARPGFDYSAFWARSGIMSLVGHPDAPPVLSRVAQGDHTTGMNGLAATLAALRLRDLTGEGQVVELSLQRTGVYTIATDFAKVLVDGNQPARFNRAAPPNPMHNTYRAADGRWIMLVHMTPDPYWPKLCAAVERDDWAAGERYRTMRGRQQFCAEIAAELERMFALHDSAYWYAALDRHGLIWAPMAELPEVIADPQLAENDMFPALEYPNGSYRTVNTPFVIRGSGLGPKAPAPLLGDATADVLREYGISEERVAELAANGVLG